jgi:hypothetical protein
MDTTIKQYETLAYALRRAGIGVTFLALAVAARANINLVTNGSFESNGGNGQLAFNTTADGWSVPALNNSYTFLYGPGTADTTGATSQYGNVSLWGPGTGVANGLPATSPDGGFYIAQDSDFQLGAISQTINGLTVGQKYTVSFYWAAAQQFSFNGATSDNWSVSLGSSTQTTDTVNLDSNAFSPWTKQSFTFTADNTSDLLSFFAGGTPQGPPPFALLDGVTMSATPEPALYVPGLALMGVLVGLGIRRSKKSVKI